MPGDWKVVLARKEGNKSTTQTFGPFATRREAWIEAGYLRISPSNKHTPVLREAAGYHTYLVWAN